MNLHVLDTSALIRLFFADGPMPAGLVELARDVDAGGAALVAPELIWVEAAHAVQRKLRRGELSSSERDAVWRALRRTPVEVLPIVRHVDRALALSVALDVSVYDAMYLAVAEHVDGRLWTADKDLAHAARGMGLDVS